MVSKVVRLSKLLPILERAKLSGEAVVFTNGCFDLFHAGHAHLLREAAKLGDILVVGLNSDESVKKIKGDFRPIIPDVWRAHVLTAVGVVDYIVMFDEPTPEMLVEAIRPHVLVKGRAYELLEVAGSGAAGRVEYVGEIPGVSTSEIIKAITERTGDECSRKSWSLATL